jgi:hypothetical protein
MNTNELIQYAAQCYFWVFIVLFIISFALLFTDEYAENKRNSIKGGTFFGSEPEMILTIIRWVLFFVSIKLM